MVKLSDLLFIKEDISKAIKKTAEELQPFF